MKKNRFIILPALFWLLGIASYGQGIIPSEPIFKTSFGLKAGANLATINNGQETINFSPSMKTDFQIGAVANLHFGKHCKNGSTEGSPVGTGWFALQPELLYSRQGFKVNSETVNFDYISLPIMAKLYVAKGYNFEVGPYFSYMLSASPTSTVIDGARIAISDLKGGKDAGIAVGIGYESKSGGLTVGARYNYGMSDLTNNLKWKNNVIAISVGWLF